MLTPVTGGVTAAGGFLAAGVRCGLRKPGDERPDLAVIYSESPAAAAAVFTTNRVQAAPVLVSREHITGGRARVVVANSGGANACTGEQGMSDARRMAAVAAQSLGLAPDEVLVASTGVIGMLLPMDKVEAGIRQAAAALNSDGNSDAAVAITTTDLIPKESARRIALGGQIVTVGGIAKGSGMIKPNMATMLGFLTTDAAMAPQVLQQALSAAVDRTFNMITVDNDTSTNDTVFLLANGRAGNAPIEAGSPELRLFQQALDEVCIDLAKAIARDGEGATKLLEVALRGAVSTEDARKAALAVAGSSLVKTAIFGADANWGRVMAALGYSGASFDPEQVEINLGPMPWVRGGRSAGFDEAQAKDLLSQTEVILDIRLNNGEGQAVAWGCDLTYDYVKINGSYRS